MIQDQIDVKTTNGQDSDLRRHLIAALRIVEKRLSMPSSLHSGTRGKKERTK